MADDDSSEAYKPADRADVDQKNTSTQQRPRKYKDGKKLRKRDSQGILAYNVTVVSARYDNVAHCWRYKLKDYKGEAILGMTKETELG